MAAKEEHMLKQGAEAKLLKTEFLGKTVLIKERFSKKYRHPALDELLTKERTKAEAKYLLKCRKLGIHTPAVYYIDTERNAIYMEYIEDSVTVREHIQSLQAKGSGGIDLEQLGSKIGNVIGILHGNNIVHGDLTTSNMLLRGDNLVLIDFGLSHTEINVEDKGVDLYVLERAILSTHPNSEGLFDYILNSYKDANTKDVNEVLKKLDEVRLRGRKRTMIG